MSLNVRRVLQLKGGVGMDTVRPDASVADAVAAFDRSGVATLMVTRDDGSFVGVLRRSDIAAALADAGCAAPGGVVADFVSQEASLCRLDEDVRVVARRIADAGDRHLPVVDTETLVGVISSGDVMRAMLRDATLREELIAPAA